MKTSMPARAFDVLVEHRQFDEALMLVGWKRGQQPDRAWLNALPVRTATPAQAALWRFDLALRVARLRHALGYRDEAFELLVWLKSAADANDASSHDYDFGPHQFQLRLAQEAFRLGYEELAWSAAENADYLSRKPPFIVERLFGTRAREAVAWWSYLDRAGDEKWSMFPEAIRATATGADGERRSPLGIQLRMIDRVLNPSPDESREDFAALVGAAIDSFAEFNEDNRARHLTAVALTCLKHNRPELAESAVRQLDPHTQQADFLSVMTAMADCAFRQRNWAKAAEYYEEVWQGDHDQLVRLYMAGEARRQQGQTELGRRQQQLAVRLASTAEAVHRLAVALKEAGLAESASELFRMLVRAAPSGHLHWHDANRVLAEDSAKSPAERAALTELYLLLDLRSNFYLLDDRDYLRVPARARLLAAEAALADGDVESAERYALTALQFLPGNFAAAAKMVTQLDAAGYPQHADRIFWRSFEHAAAVCRSHPLHAELHHELAEFAVQTHRRLDDAVSRAETALRLSPDNVRYLRTLAEAHFRKGNREHAIETIDRAVRLEPNDAENQSALDRYTDDLLPLRD